MSISKLSATKSHETLQLEVFPIEKLHLAINPKSTNLLPGNSQRLYQ